MKVEIIILLGIFLSFNLATKELQLLQVLTRHGDRTPIFPLPSKTVSWYCKLTDETYPTTSSMNQNTTKLNRIHKRIYIEDRELLAGNCSAGQLTSIGAQQHYQMGLQFRQTYIKNMKFLPDQFDSNLIWIRSTDIPRTRDSVQNNFRGLYPPQTSLSYDEVFPLYTVDFDFDWIYANSVLCPRIGFLAQNLFRSSEWINHMTQIQTLTEELMEIFNVSESEISYIWINDDLTCRKAHNISFPDGVTTEIAEQVHDEAQWELAAIYAYQEVANLSIGLLVRDMIQAMEASINKTSELKYLFYSAHDSSVAPFLQAYNVYDGIIIAYAGHIVLELYYDEDVQKYYVQMIYNGNPLQIPGCDSTYCDFDFFQSVSYQIIPQNYEALCHSTSNEDFLDDFFWNLN
ncbi:lysophosphatidic acid phosphatase type 6 [Anaeramoeba ignava]|uniref:Lysophosphatidic acid phosphatase type 6 n=1 Tax=Anaeramoeba ignava TaxID=1746090 RepID=A0A9Q0LFX4_ANAIG|nr:lysophosphatidic acid phosphatase type 6 [Anaeramoeba ignava]